jgi:hypothetical protein
MNESVLLQAFHCPLDPENERANLLRKKAAGECSLDWILLKLSTVIIFRLCGAQAMAFASKLANVSGSPLREQLAPTVKMRPHCQKNII